MKQAVRIVRKPAAGWLPALVLALLPVVAIAQARDDREPILFDIPSQRADLALTAFAEQADLTLVVPFDLVRDKTTNELRGRYSIAEGIGILLEGTGLEPSLANRVVLTIAAKAPSQERTTDMHTAKKTGIGALLAALVASNAGAQEDSTRDTERTLEEIVVTASRREQSLQDVPMAVVALKPDDFVEGGLTNLSDVINYVPGFNFSNITGGARGKGTIEARGLGQQGRAAVVGVYLDDVPVTSSNLFGSIFYLDGTLEDLERVEFLKGPQGTLYGASSIGGAVRYVTRKPSLDELRVSLKSSFSTTEDGGSNELYAARLSVPLVADRLAVSLAGYLEDNAGFVDRLEPGTGTLMLEDADGFESKSISADVLYRPTDRLELRARVLDQNTDYAGLSVVNIDENLDPVYRSRAGDDALSSNDLNNTVYSATVQYRFDSAELVATSSYAEANAVRVLDGTAFFAAFVDLLEGNPPGTTTSVPVLGDQGFEKFSQEIRLASTGEGPWEWLGGLFYTEEDIHTITSAFGLPTNFDLLTENETNGYEEIAAFGNVTYYFTPQLDLTLGTRITRIETDSGTTTGSGALFGGESDAPNVIEKTVDTWLLAARYRPSDDTSFYARIASGYRPAVSLASVPIDPVTNEPLGSTLIDPDSLWSYELGVKGELADGRLGYDLALWHIDWDDFQTVLVFGGFTVLANAEGGITSQGVEAALTFRPHADFTITSAVAFTDSTLNSDEPGIFGLKGQQLPHIPRWAGSLRARYDFDLFGDTRAYVAGGLRYEDEKRGAFADENSLDPHDPNPPVPANGNVNIPTDPVLLADLSAGIVKGPFTFSLFASNLFDDDSYTGTSALVTPGTADFTATGVPVRPRTIGLTIGVEF